jgi:pimeloyl-ACP methyl ester carboxylesterase
MLLHGVGSNAESFAPLMDALPPSIGAVAWNAPGYGMSKPLVSEFPAPFDYGVVLHRLLDALDLSQVILVGHSLGALFAGSFAARYPNRVAALGLLSPALGYSVPPGSPLPAAVQARIDEINALGPAAFAAKRAPRLIGDSRASPHIVSAVERAMGRVHPAGYTQAVRALGAGNLIADLETIVTPTLVAVGDKDSVTPPDKVRPAHDCLKNPVGYHLIAGAGHALPQEDPDAVAGLLFQLVEAHTDT